MFDTVFDPVFFVVFSSGLWIKHKLHWNFLPMLTAGIGKIAFTILVEIIVTVACSNIHFGRVLLLDD